MTDRINKETESNTENFVSEEYLKEISGGSDIDIEVARKSRYFKLVCENPECGFQLFATNDQKNAVYRCIKKKASTFKCPKCRRAMHLRRK